MKFMRRVSWSSAVGAGGTAQGWRHARLSRHAFSKQLLELDMKWETPQATDFRFGMEITMYIANRWCCRRTSRPTSSGAVPLRRAAP